MAKLTFFELLGVTDALGAATRWPRTAIAPAIGEPFDDDDDPEDYVDLMQFLQESLTFVGMRSGGDAEQHGFWAELRVEPAPFPEERPLVAAALPDFAFVLEATGPLPATVFVTRSVTTGATEVVVQGLPVRIVFPLGFIEPYRTTEEAALPPPLPAKRLTVPFDPAIPDSLEVVLSDADPSYIRVRVNVRLSAAGDVYVDTAVPVSIGPCYLSALPCRAVHDLQLIPSGHLRDVPAELPLEWTRHPFLPDLSRQPGVVTFRTIDFDPDHPTVAAINRKIHEGRAEADAVEFVLDDVALGHFFLPLHGRFALRRALITPEALAIEAFDLTNAPARIKVGPLAMHIYRLLLQTIPLDGTELPIAFDIALTEADAAAVPGAESLAISVDQKGVVTGTHVFAENRRRHLFTVAGAEFSLAAVRFGFAFLQMGKSVKRPGLGIPDPGLLPKWADPAILVFDFVVKPGQSTKLVKAESKAKPDKPVLLHDVGWSLGKVSLGAISNLNVDFTIAKAFRLRIEELGFITDADGENYLMMSASIGTPAELANDQSSSLGRAPESDKEKQASGSGFGLRIQRLRFQIGAPAGGDSRVQIDGLSLWIRTKVFELLGFGMVSERDEDPPGNHYEEMGFELKLRLKLQAVSFEIGVQFFHGTVTGVDDFSYWMFGFLLGVLPVGSMELSQLRVLAVKNMTPRLDAPGDSTAEEMRLLRWFKRDGDALSLRLDRKLAAWMPLDASTAGGVGASLTLAGTKAVRIGLFAFAFDSPQAAGLLVGLEIYLAKSPDPIAFAALQWDPQTDKWGVAIGLNLSLRQLLGKDAPKWLVERGIGLSLTGLIYFGNQPDTIAIGQYNDVATWLAVQFQVKVLGKLELSALAAFCRHSVDRPEGPRVTGLMLQAKGQLKLGVGQLQFYTTFSLMTGQWRNEGIATGTVFLIEAGIRIRLFRVLNVGANIHVECSTLGPQEGATYSRQSFRLSIETPWFFPDVTVRWENIEGEAESDRQAVVSPPLVGAAAIMPGARPAQAIGHTSVTPDASGNPERVYAVKELRAAVPLLPSDEDFAALTLVSVDSTIALDCKASLDAEATPLPATPQGAGTQAPSDLSVRYVLQAVGVRRRPRFGTGAGVWQMLLDPASTELPPLTSLPPVLQDIMAPVVGFDWDADVHREGDLDPRRLLVNARTPYSFATGAPASDELLADAQSGWPCCERFPKPPDWHRVDWSDTAAGARAPVSARFSDSRSTFQWLTPRPPVVVVAAGQKAARVRTGELGDGLIARARFDARVFACQVFVQWDRSMSNASLVIDAFDGLSLVASRAFSLGPASPAEPFEFERAAGLTSLTLRRTPGDDGPFEGGGSAIRVRLVRYRTVEEQRAWLVAGARCQAQQDRLTGIRRFAWLPNHDYEILLRVRVEVGHTGTGTQSTLIDQRAFFRTKGLPGLNAVAFVGEEVEPYVESRYPHVADRLYRREALAVAFNERFNILAPVDRPLAPHAPLEADQLLEWSLAVEKPTSALGFERVSVTSPDWISTHRATPRPRGPRDPLSHALTFTRSSTRTALSLDPLRARFEHMQARPGGCGRPRQMHSSQVLTHDPLDVATPDAATPRWEADTDYEVNLRRKNGPFAERERFDPLDVPAFLPAAHGGPSGAWVADAGALGSPGAPASALRLARFGDVDDVWMHVQLRARVRPNTGAAGLGVALDAAASPITGGWVALVDRTSGTTTLRLLEIDGATVHERDSTPLAAAPDEPVLELFAFDDAVVARVGDADVSAARGARRLGRAALVVQGDGQVASLRAIALDACRLAFRSSRYDDFVAHIGSAGGVVEERAADAFGPVQSSVAALYAQTREEIVAAMAPEAPAEARERLVETWANARALLFRQTPDRVAMVRTVEAGGSTLFVLEGPEPLAFSRDVTIELFRRTHASPPTIGPELENDFPSRPLSGVLDAPAVILRWLGSFEWVDGRLMGSALPRGLEAAQRIILVGGSPVQRLRTDFRIVREAGSFTRRGAIELIADRPRRLLPGELPRLRPGDLQIDGPDGPLVPPFRPPFPWPPRPVVLVPQRVVVLTNGDETRALVIPVDAAGEAVSLPNGSYRFRFAIDRVRWRADVPDVASNYRAETMFDAQW